MTSNMNYREEELQSIGFKKIGKNVQIHNTVLIFGPGNIEIGSNVRIDCYTVVTAGEKGLKIGNNVHIGNSASILASGARTIIADFCGISSRVNLFTSSDDYSGGHLTNPTIPPKYRSVISKPVTLNKHVIVGSGSIIMPGVTIGQAAAIGALSFVNKSIPAFAVVSGNPLRKISERPMTILDLEKQYLEESG